MANVIEPNDARRPSAGQHDGPHHAAEDRRAPRLTTFGRPSLHGSALNRPKPLLLLAYLAIEGPKRRRYLAELFFPNAKDPRDALSTTLARLNRAYGGIIATAGDLVRADVGCDALDVLAHLDAGRPVAAVREYTAPFLDGLDLPMPAELEDWVYATREHLAERVRDAAIDAVSALARVDGSDDDVVAAAVALTERGDPDPHALRRLASALRRLGHGMTERLMALAARHDVVPGETTDDVPHVLGLGLEPAGPLFGRDVEVRSVTEALCRSGVRLITIHGPGGVGKTHLAHHVVRHPSVAARFRRHRAVVHVEAASDATLLPRAIATALDLTLPPDATPWVGLATVVGERPVLVVLDGWELHLSATSHLATFVRSAPGAQVLVTSRERIHLAEEHVLSLSGLALPVNSDAAEVRESAAVRMLVSEARRHDLTWAVSDTDLGAAARVCKALGGLPLGLRLAAAWMRSATLADIAVAVERDVMALDQVDPERSVTGPLASVVDRSWAQLGARGRAIARRLSVFRCGFRREAAAAVAGASIADLTRLVDGAWLSMRRDGRFEQHAVLRQHALAALERDAAASHDAHGLMARTLGALVTAYASSAGAASPLLLRLVTEEEANLVACLEWASAVSDGDTLVTLAEALLWYFATTGRFQEAQVLFKTAATRLPDGVASTDEARAHLLTSLAWCCRFAGDVDEATEHARAALVAARRSRSSLALVRALDTIGIVHVLRGENESARTHLVAGLTLAERSGDEVRANRIREKLVYALMGLAEMEAADTVAAEALAQVDDGRVPQSIDAIATHVAHAYLSLAQGRWDRAEAASVAGLRLARSLDYHGPQPLLRAASALATVRLGGDRDEQVLASGATAAEQVLPIARQYGDGTAEAFARMALAWACRVRGHQSEALEHVRAGLRTAAATGNRLTRAWLLPVAVAVHEAAGDTRQARETASALLSDPSTPAWIARELTDRGYTADPSGGPGLDALVAALLEG